MDIPKKILLTGGSGFIGRHILECLGSKFQILAPTHHELELTDADAVLAYFKKNPVDIVVHTANRGGSRKDKNLLGVAEMNLRIFFNLVRAKPYYTRMIVLGSGAEYDKRRSLTKVSEDEFDTSVPLDEYGWYKYVCSQYIAQVDFILNLRVFAAFGPYEDCDIRFISNAICKTLLEIPITIKQNVIFDYLYVTDLVRVIEYFIDHTPLQKCYNVGSGKPVDLITIANDILAITQRNVPVAVALPGLGNEYSCSIDRLVKDFTEFSPRTLSDSLQKLTEYYRSILPTLSRDRFLHDV